MHIEIEDLPGTIQTALKNAGFACKDIAVYGSETYSVSCGGSQGRRSFAIMVNLVTGASEAMVGSWGGANVFNQRNNVDLDNTSRPLPDGFALVKGSSGYGGCHAVLYVAPSNLAKLLPVGAGDALMGKEKAALELFRYKGGPYRHDEAAREGLNYSATDPLFAGLIERGYIKANKAGSMQITTKGKNAR